MPTQSIDQLRAAAAALAHGLSVSEMVMFAGTRMNLREAAKIAKDSLRFAISKFIPDSKSPPYLDDAYWIDLHTR